MTLEPDQIMDRRRLRRKLTFWRVAALVLVVALIGFAFGFFGGEARQPHVARVSVDDVILEDMPRHKMLQSIARDDNARAVVVRINSPGGSTVGSENLFDDLRDVAERKPVVAVIGTVGASGAYITALAADYIIAHETSLTGSIGVIMQAPEISGLLGKLGIEVTEIKSGSYKGEPSVVGPMDKDVRAYLDRLIQDAHQWFVRLVAKRRGMSEEAVGRLADGRVFTGGQAQDLGLIDALGGETEAREWLENEHGVSASLPLLDKSPERDLAWLTQVTEAVFKKSLLTERLKLDGLLTLWQP